MGTDELEQALHTAQLIDQFSAKGVMAIMLMATLGVCFFLIKRIFVDMDSLKKQIEINANTERNIERIADSTKQSIELAKEQIKEQKEHNNTLRLLLEGTIESLRKKIEEMDNKYSSVLRKKCDLKERRDYEI